MTSKRIGFALLVVFVACIMTGAHGKNTSKVVTKPFKIKGGGFVPTGLIPPPEPPDTEPVFASYAATGTATQLGKYTTEEGVFTITSFNPDTLTGEFYGSVVFVAANGDELKFKYMANPEIEDTGMFFGEIQEDDTLIATFVQEFTPVSGSGTGRFANVTGGSFIMIAESEPVELPYFGVAFAFTWKGEGSLEFAKGKK